MAVNMEKQSPEKKDIFKDIIEAQTSSPEFDRALSQIESQISKISEAVGERAGEDIKPSGGKGDDQKTKPYTFGGISSRIFGLLGAKKHQKIVLPSKKIQQQEVVKALSMEVKKLVKETHKVQNSRKYSPAKMEELLMRIRGLQKMISEVFHVATETLTQWYKKYVLKKG